MTPAAEALTARAQRTPTGCLVWAGKRHHTGYGVSKVAGRRRPVHRLMWEACNGPIPDGLLVLHRCDVRPCIEPAHLFLGTDRDNVHDMIAKGRSGGPHRIDLTPDDLAPFTGQRHWKVALSLGVSEETVRARRREYRAALASIASAAKAA